MKTPKNYFLYFHKGKVERQAIKMNAIHPEWDALQRIPSDADVFAKIFAKNTKIFISQWLKYDVINSGESESVRNWNQLGYVEKFLPLITPEEVTILENSTAKIRARIFQDGI